MFARFGDLLLNRRAVTSRDKLRSERLARDIAGKHIVKDLAEQAGSKRIRLAGRGGSGKTTALALLASELATMRGERVLVLTFHRALRGDIEHLLRTLLDPPELLGRRVRVETMTEFLMAALNALELEIPRTPEGAIAFTKLDDTLREAAVRLADGRNGEWAKLLRAEDPTRFEWDHVCIDEAQDWTDAERDFLLRLFGHRLIVIFGENLRPVLRCGRRIGLPIVVEELMQDIGNATIGKD